MKHALDRDEDLSVISSGAIATDEDRYAFFVGLENYLNNRYKTLRESEYPPITDYLDAVVKGDQAQIDKYIADCLAVKAKYPKPSST
jgi:hypothetical protein